MSASLRNRVAVTLALFGAVTSVLLAGAIYWASHDLERRLIDDTLNAELDDLIERRQRNPASFPEHTATIRAYVVSAGAGSPVVPEPVAGLPPGQHQLVLETVPYRAAVRSVGGQRFVVMYNVSALRRRERGFALLLAGSVLLITAISALSGRWLASRVIAPVTELAHRVGGLRPEDAPPPLAGEFPWTEIQQLAADFDAYLERLHAFIERERLFTGDISHELRTPLAVVSGAAELLLADTALDERNQARVERIGRAVAEMSEMTAALLALAREEETAAPPKAPCPVEQVARELVERYRTLFRNKPVRLSLDVAARPSVPVDCAVLSMVLGNLLRNALGYTDRGEVRVRVEPDAVEIVDTGPGLGDTDVEALFEAYVRGPQSRGAGLGLSLVRRLCERHGWEVTLAGHADAGTRARLRFAASPATVPTAPS